MRGLGLTLLLAAVSLPPPLSAEPVSPAPAKPQTEWVKIPGGSFLMGADDQDPAERPVRPVTVKAFELAKTLVTFKQYNACVAAGACTPPHLGDHSCFVPLGDKWGRGNLDAKFQGDDQPVVCVGWDQASEYAAWAGGRLPTEAEFEYAARSGGKDYKYPWGNEPATCERAVVVGRDGLGCGLGSTAPVCSKPKGNSEQGLCDMAGNVWEWVQDWYHDDYRGAPATSAAWLEPATNKRSARGGPWSAGGVTARATNRGNGAVPPLHCSRTGFRIAR